MYFKVLDYVMWPLIAMSINGIAALVDVSPVDLYKLTQLISQ